jgi:hypothetical protein
MPLEFATISVLAGIVLGQRYKILILFPAVALAIVFPMIVGIARADHFWSIILTAVISGTAVQVGYLAGIMIRAVVEGVILIPRTHQQHAGQEAPSAINQTQTGSNPFATKSGQRAA